MSDSKKITVLAMASVKIRKTNPELCAPGCPYLSDGRDCHLYNIRNNRVGDDTYRKRDDNKIERNSRCLLGEDYPAAIVSPLDEMTWEKGG